MKVHLANHGQFHAVYNRGKDAKGMVLTNLTPWPPDKISVGTISQDWLGYIDISDGW